MRNDNHKYTYSKCIFCGKKESWICDSWLVPDGEDDVDWDFNEYCINKQCPSNNYKLIRNMKTNEYPKIKATQFDIETKTLLGNVDFSGGSIFITIKRNDEDDDQTYNITLDDSEQLNDLSVIIEMINNFNLGE